MAEPAEHGATRGVVASPVHCRRCGYNLFGLQADGACPECGLEVWETILHTVDPAASRLPRLRDPTAVGNALLWLMICLVAGALLQLVRPVALWLDDMDRSGLRNLSGMTPPVLTIAAGLIVFAGLWSVWRLLPPKGAESDSGVWRHVWLLGCGLFGWAILVVIATALEMSGSPRWVMSAIRLVLAGAAVVPLFGLRGVLGTIGLRSRVYRTARGGRQGIHAMVAAIAGLALGHTISLLSALGGGLRHLATLGTAVIAISALMLMVGLAYLVVNAWWIRRSLLCPPPTWDEILRTEENVN